MSSSPLRDPKWWRGLLKDGFGGDFWAYLAIAAVAGIVVYAVKGEVDFEVALREDFGNLLSLVPRILAAISVAGLLWAMLPREKLVSVIGRESSWRGLLMATFAGSITPGGPSSAFPLLALLAGAGADRGALVAYITAWSTLGLQRILVWEVPFLGPEFAITRYLVTLPLPIIAGLIARRLPFELHLRALPDERASGQKRERETHP